MSKIRDFGAIFRLRNERAAALLARSRPARMRTSKQVALPRPLPETVERLSLEENIISDCAEYRVTFNGEIQNRCTVADAKRGYIVRYTGREARDPASGETYAETETLQGVVTIQIAR